MAFGKVTKAVFPVAGLGSRAEVGRGSAVSDGVPAIARFSAISERLVAAESRAPAGHRFLPNAVHRGAAFS